MTSQRSRPLVGAAIGVGYFLGTLPTATAVARGASGGALDLRSEGSGNPGAANAIGVLGKRVGAVVLVGDVGKGVVASLLGGVIGGPVGAHLAGTAAVAGHCYPVWNGFDGGKGVAAGVGQCLATSPAAVPVAGSLAAVIARSPLRHRAFAATVTSTVCWVGAATWSWRRGAIGGSPTTSSWALPVGAALSSAIIVKRFLDAAGADASVEESVEESVDESVDDSVDDASLSIGED